MVMNQVADIHRMKTPGGSLDLTLVSRLDSQQLASTTNRRSSLPLGRYVSILDEQQNKYQRNEAVLNAINKIVKLRVRVRVKVKVKSLKSKLDPELGSVMG